MREGRMDSHWTDRKLEGDKPVPGRIASLIGLRT